MVAGQPWMQQTFVSGQAFLFVADEQASNEVFALVGHVTECIVVKVPVACFNIFQCGHVIVAGKRRQATEPIENKAIIIIVSNMFRLGNFSRICNYYYYSFGVQSSGFDR